MIGHGESKLQLAKINMQNDRRWGDLLGVSEAPTILRISHGAVYEYDMETFARTAAAFTKFATTGFKDRPLARTINVDAVALKVYPRAWFASGTVSLAAAWGFFTIPALLLIAVYATMGFAKFNKDYVEAPVARLEAKWLARTQSVDELGELAAGDEPDPSSTKNKKTK